MGTERANSHEGLWDCTRKTFEERASQVEGAGDALEGQQRRIIRKVMKFQGWPEPDPCCVDDPGSLDPYLV